MTMTFAVGRVKPKPLSMVCAPAYQPEGPNSVQHNRGTSAEGLFPCIFPSASAGHDPRTVNQHLVKLVTSTESVENKPANRSPLMCKIEQP